MRSLVFALLVMLLPAVASAQAAGPNTDVQNTIAAQIEAFAAEDVEQAFSFASPFIQRQFGNPENFGAMVRSGYPMVWAPAEVYYHEQAEQGGATWQQVQFVDAAGDEYGIVGGLR